jgi:hypothetical protein
VVPVLVVVLGLALADALVVGLALAVALTLAVALALAVTVGDAVAVAVGNVLWWCLQNDALAMLSDPPLTATIAPIPMAAATGMAIVAARRARRLL